MLGLVEEGIYNTDIVSMFLRLRLWPLLMYCPFLSLFLVVVVLVVDLVAGVAVQPTDEVSAESITLC